MKYLHTHSNHRSRADILPRSPVIASSLFILTGWCNDFIFLKMDSDFLDWCVRSKSAVFKGEGGGSRRGPYCNVNALGRAQATRASFSHTCLNIKSSSISHNINVIWTFAGVMAHASTLLFGLKDFSSRCHDRRTTVGMDLPCEWTQWTWQRKSSKPKRLTEVDFSQKPNKRLHASVNAQDASLKENPERIAAVSREVIAGLPTSFRMWMTAFQHLLPL